MGKLTEAEYITIKQLLAKGYQGKEIAEIVGRGQATVSGVKNTADYDDYREKLSQDRADKQEKGAVSEQLKLEAPEDKRSNIFVAFSKVFDAIYDYKQDIEPDDAIGKRVIDIATERLEEAKMWLKNFL